MSSGRTRSRAERRAAGKRRLEVQLDDETMKRLDILCLDSGITRADQIRAMIDREWGEIQKLKR